jgi:uncharacterized membrane protein YfcA
VAVSSLAIFLAAFVAGAINSVAGGGTLVTFPTLVWVGLPSTIANATSTVAIWPGSLGGMWGYRHDLKGLPKTSYTLIVPSLLGGIIGAVLLVLTPTDVFDRLIPLLILFATVLFMLQEPIQRLIGTTDKTHEGSSVWLVGALVFQLFVSVYGGYFGAGIGILMLAALGLMGFTSIHRMNGLKNWGGLCINAVAAVTFAISGLVDWPVALAMAVGAMAGGYGGSRLAQRVPQDLVRAVITAIGLASALWLALR